MRVSHTGLEPRTGRLQAGLLLTRLSLALDRRCRATKAPSSPRPQTLWASSSGAPRTYGCSPCPYGCSLRHLRLQPLPPTVAVSASYGCSLRHTRLQPVPPTVAASASYGCSLCFLRLQPLPPTVTARASYGCSLCLLRLQPPPHTVAGARASSYSTTRSASRACCATTMACAYATRGSNPDPNPNATRGSNPTPD